VRSFLAASASLLLLLASTNARAQADSPGDAAQPGSAQAAARMALTPVERRHASDDWKILEPHLPDPKTANAERLEMAGDVLRARKFPDESVEYYQYALTRGGGRSVVLLNKIGVAQMELENMQAAQLNFKRATQINPKDPEGWNNLASVEYVLTQYGRAVGDYKKAIKLDKKSATFHSNLATAYFSQKEFDRARKEYETAIRLDPHIFEYHGTGGMRTQMQTASDRGRYCFEMARIAGKQGNDTTVVHWLGMAAESGFDIMDEMRGDNVLSKYRKDPRILSLVQTAKGLENRRPAGRSGDPVPALPTSTPF